MLSSPSKHAIRALLYLSEFSNSDYCSVAELADKTDLPKAYLSKIVHALANRSLVVTKKGTGGGVAIGEKSVSFYDICEALDDPIIREHCFLSSTSCDCDAPCPFHTTWNKERERLLAFLRKNKIQKKVA